MSHIHAEASATIDADPGLVYDILADYKEGHQLVLPEEYFSDLVVEEGGEGEGTVISFDIKVGGNTTSYKMRVEEPQPGRVLVERDLNSDTRTTFTVDPVGNKQSRVKIETDWTGSGGVKGLVERIAAPGMLRKVYEAELRKLEEVALAHMRPEQGS